MKNSASLLKMVVALLGLQVVSCTNQPAPSGTNDTRAPTAPSRRTPPTTTLSTPSSTAWTYKSPNGDFHLTLPDAEWKQYNIPKMSSRPVFSRQHPEMVVSILVVKSGADREAFEEAKKASRLRVSKDAKQVRFREGKTDAGNEYSYLTLSEAAPGRRPAFVAYSVVWRPDKKVLFEVLFEGHPEMRSEIGKATEQKTFEKAAEQILLSVE